MSDPRRPDPARVARTKRTTRLVFGSYIVVLTTFVLSNIVQVVRVLYFGPENDWNARAIKGEPCRRELEALATGIERAVAEAASARDATAAEAAYRLRRAEYVPVTQSAEQKCAAEPNGPEALAALVRLDRAGEATARRRGEALAPVRREVDSFIR